MNSDFPDVPVKLKEAQDAAHTVGLQLEVMNADTDWAVDDAFARITALRVGALIVLSDPFLFSRRERIVPFAVRNSE